MSARYPGVQRHGSHWTIRYLVGGKRIRERTTARTMREAAKLRDQRLREIEAGTWVHPSERKRKLLQDVDPALGAPTFGELVDVYMRRWAPNVRSLRYQNCVRNVAQRDLGADTPLPLITPDRLERWREDMLARGLSASTVRHYLLWVSNVFNRTAETAEGRRLLAKASVTSNPRLQVRLPKAPQAAKDSLSLDQARQFLTANRLADRHLFRWAFLMLRTGVRVLEAGELELEDLDFDQGLLRILDTKTGRPRTIACDMLNEDQRIEDGETWRELKKWRLRPGERLVGAALPYDPRRWEEAFERAELPYGAEPDHFTARNLRTTFIAIAYQHGFRPEDLVPQTGHSLQTMTQHYLDFVPGRRPRREPLFPRLLGRASGPRVDQGRTRKAGNRRR